MTDKAFDFLMSHRDVAFATVDGGKPKIRVIPNHEAQRA